MLHYTASYFLGNERVSEVYIGTEKIFPILHPKTEALITAAVTNGYDVPMDIMPYDTFIKAWDEAGLFSKTDRLFLTTTGISAGFKSLNIADPTKSFTMYGGLVNETNGIRGSSVNGSISTNFNTATDAEHFSLNNCTIGLVITEHNIGTGNSAIAVGYRNTTQNIYAYNGTNRPMTLNSTSAAVNVSLQGAGLQTINRISSTQIFTNSNGVINYYNLNSTAIFNGVLSILSAGTTTYFSNRVLGMYFVGGLFTPSEQEQIKIIFNNFQISNGLPTI